MNELEYLLMVVAEECGEVAQRASKAARFGMSEIQPGQPDDNRRRMERELADLMATADLLGLRVREEDKAAKVEKLKKFMALSREKGMLEDRSKLGVQVDDLRKHLRYICNIAERLGPNASKYHREEALQMLAGTLQEAEDVWRKTKRFCGCGLEITDALHVCRPPQQFPEKQVESSRPLSCNRHQNCADAEAKLVASGRQPGVSFHCWSEDCEDCFGC